jgi:CheY-like chemotaxis protein
VLDWMRRTAATRLLTVVVLTSSNQHADVRRAYEMGANSYLVKPVSRDALLDMVRTLNYYWLFLNQPAA